MPIYEIINPSDACTIEAPDDRTAIAAVAILSEGAYGVRELPGNREVCGISLFGGLAEEMVDAFLPAWKAGGFPKGNDVTKATIEAMMSWVGEHRTAVTDALDSFCYGDADERAFLAESMAQAADPAKVKAAHENRRRSSLNNIGKRAAQLAAHFRAKAA